LSQNWAAQPSPATPTQASPISTARGQGANFTPAADRTEAQKATLALSDSLIAEIMAADTLVISAPMYNFAIPSTLKAWIDHICRTGITFQYSAEGPKGMLTGKRAILVITTGVTPIGAAYDQTTGYLRQVMGFIGITNVEIVAADLIMAQTDDAVAKARTAIAAL